MRHTLQDSMAERRAAIHARCMQGTWRALRDCKLGRKHGCKQRQSCCSANASKDCTLIVSHSRGCVFAGYRHTHVCVCTCTKACSVAHTHSTHGPRHRTHKHRTYALVHRTHTQHARTCAQHTHTQHARTRAQDPPPPTRTRTCMPTHQLGQCRELGFNLGSAHKVCPEDEAAPARVGQRAVCSGET